MNQREEIPLEGELNCWTRGFDLPDILLAVRDRAKTGLLRFENSEAEKTLFIRGGEVIFAKSSSVDDRLGEYLLRAGKLSLPDLSKLTHLVKPGTRLGTVLIENELLNPKELVQAVIGQVRSIILSLFKWTEARYEFKEQDLPSKETITLDMPTARLILDGVKLVDSWRRIAQGVGAMSSIYKRVEGNEGALRLLDLDTTTLEVLATLTKPMSVEAISTSSVLPDIEVCRLLWVFRCLGWIEQVEERKVDSTAPVPTAEPAVEASSVEPGTETRETPVEVGEDVLSFCMIGPDEPDKNDAPEGAKRDGAVFSASDEVSIPTVSTPFSATPIPMVEPEPDQTAEALEEDLGVSLVDSNESSFDIGDGEQPIALESSPEVLFEAQNPVEPSREPPAAAAPARSAEADLSEESVEPELELEAPVFQKEPASSLTPGELSDEGPAPASESEIESDDMDMDIEGLGMVLGKSSKE